MYRALIDCHCHRMIFCLPYGFEIFLSVESVLVRHSYVLTHVISMC